MTQLDLFNPLAATADPISSHVAARELKASGEHASQMAEVLAALKQHGPCTSRELSEFSGLDRYKIARRLPDLEKRLLVIQGDVRECRFGRPAAAWRAVQ